MNPKLNRLFYLILPALLTCIYPAHAQQSLADSLKRIIGFSQDAKEVNLKFQLADAYLNYSPKKALETLEEAKTLAIQISNDSLTAEATYKIGFAQFKSGKYSESIQSFDEAREQFLKLGIVKRATCCLLGKGEPYLNSGKINEALAVSIDAYKEAESNSYKEGMGKAFLISGLVYRALGDHKKARADIEKDLAICKENGFLETEAAALNNLSNVCSDLFSEDTADLRLRDSVFLLLNQALEIDKKLNNKFAMGKVLNNLGTAYLDDSLLDKAEDYFLQALDVRKQIGDKRGQAITLTNLGAVESSRGDWDKALSYFNMALSLAKSAGESDIMIVLYQNIAEIYGNMGDSKNAILDYNKLIDLKDSIFTKSLSESTAEMQAKFDVDKANEATLQSQKEKKLITFGAIIGGFLLIVIMFFFINRATMRKRTNIKLNAQKEEIEQKNAELQHANKEIELKNKDITDSILYASRIQEAILPEVEFFNTFQDKGFVLYRPKDIVSGDFYWMAQTADHLLFAAVDCTGHGVPGAFMSIVCSNLLTQAVKEHGLYRPSEILNDVNIRLSETLRQRQDESRVRDGMDIALCSISRKDRKLSFAGAYNPVWIIRDGTITELLADKFPVGLFVEEELKKFKHQEFQLQKGDRLYVASDGYSDQFGGELGKKFKRSSFTQLLLSIQNRPILEHKALLKKAHLDWKGSYDQIDDVLVMGVEIV